MEMTIVKDLELNLRDWFFKSALNAATKSTR